MNRGFVKLALRNSDRIIFLILSFAPISDQTQLSPLLVNHPPPSIGLSALIWSRNKIPELFRPLFPWWMLIT